MRQLVNCLDLGSWPDRMKVWHQRNCSEEHITMSLNQCLETVRKALPELIEKVTAGGQVDVLSFANIPHRAVRFGRVPGGFICIDFSSWATGNGHPNGWQRIWMTALLSMAQCWRSWGAGHLELEGGAFKLHHWFRLEAAHSIHQAVLGFVRISQKDMSWSGTYNHGTRMNT